MKEKKRKGNEMANIGATTAFYKVETSLTRANSEVSKSMERLATGKANANAGDRSSYVAMADTFRLDFVGTKAGIKGASVVMGYLETGMRVLDSASALLSRLQELAVLGANDTNTTADHEAINLEAEAIADEFNRLMTTSSYKGRDVYNDTAGGLYVSMGGRDQEMTFGIGRINYGALYGTGASERTIIAATSTVDGPNKGGKFNLAHLPSDAVVSKTYGKRAADDILKAAGLDANKTYIVKSLDQDGDATAIAATEDKYQTAGHSAADIFADTSGVYRKAGGNTKITTGAITQFDVLETKAAVGAADIDSNLSFIEVNTGTNAFKAGHEYEIMGFGTQTATVTVANFNEDAAAIGRAVTGINNTDTLTVGQKFTVDANVSVTALAHLNAMTGQMTFRQSTDTLTKDIEAIQGLVNTARVQAGSQYAALESAVNYTTDLTAQYELGYNTVNDVNFSMETAHLAKNQILQQAATAMLAQANQGQQGLLQLIS